MDANDLTEEIASVQKAIIIIKADIEARKKQRKAAIKQLVEINLNLDQCEQRLDAIKNDQRANLKEYKKSHLEEFKEIMK